MLCLGKGHAEIEMGGAPRWFVRDHFEGQPRQIWRFQDQAATRMGVTNPEGGPGSHFTAKPGEDFFDCIRRQTPWMIDSFYEAALGPGEYYPRMARPLAQARQSMPMFWSGSVATEKNFIASARSQLTSLTRRLQTICQTVQPSEKNLDVYGHEIRSLLILAATEAETHWRGILEKNGCVLSRPNTNDYVKLIEPLKLLDYSIIFHDFPDLQPIRPFAGWSKADPTNTLGWYAAYNGVKHNREGEFERGNLRHAFEAVSACTALQVAQFGPTALNAELLGFVVPRVPDWPTGEMYLSPLISPDWTPVSHPALK
jgi:hypothetical protein